MRSFLPAVALLLAAAPALAGGAEEFFMGRPPSAGVVQGGVFGAGGSDYLGELRDERFAAPRAVRPARSARRVVHAARVRPGDASPVVARPYIKP